MWKIKYEDEILDKDNVINFACYWNLLNMQSILNTVLHYILENKWQQ